MAQPGKNRTRYRHSQAGAHMEPLAGLGWAPAVGPALAEAGAPASSAPSTPFLL